MRDALSIDRAATARANREVHADWPAPPPAAFPRSPSSAIGVNRCLRSVIGADPGSSHCQPLPAIANIPFARASATIPGLFKPVPYRQRSLVDGGLVDNLPTNLVAVGENDFVLAVLPQADEERDDVDTILKTLVRAVEIQKDVMMAERKRDADFLIEPRVGTVSIVDLNRSAECIEAGQLATRQAAVELKKKILQRMKP
jgi:hypothetical protein